VAEPPARADEIFADALERAPSERTPFLDDACRGDDELRARVATLLEAHARAGEFLERPIVDADVTGWAPDEANLAGVVVGAYRVVERIGTGGMSTVWRAERADAEFEKTVAVKMIAPGPETAEILRRFRTERQVLAGLEHPNIARLLDGGMTPDGRPYLVMEYVDGVPIDRYCAEHALSVEARLELFAKVCAAVNHAHRHLVVHRDLKPNNVLVDAGGSVKLLDFGIAKVLDPDSVAAAGSSATRTVARAMTPRYASPEQFRGDAITTAADVYSLGIVLYELLTGESPYRIDGGSPAEIERVVCDTEPTRPSVAVASGTSERERERPALPDVDRRRWSRRLAGDLDNILLMALRKEPDRRYESVEQLAEDLRRHLAGLPVVARPDTLGYRTRTFVRRNLAAVSAAVFAVLLLVAATGVSTTLWLDARRAREDAERARAHSDVERERSDQIAGFLRDMLSTIDPDRAQGRDTELLQELLDGSAERLDRELGDRPGLAWELHQTIGATYLGLGEATEAERHHRRAMEILKRSPPGEDDRDSQARHARDLATTIVGLTHALGDLGRDEDARGLLLDALDLPFGAAPTDRLARASILGNLAVCLERGGDADGAERRYREAVAIRREVGEGNEVDLAVSLGDLGRFLTVQDRRPEAEPFLIEALDIARAHVDEKPLLAAGLMMNLGDWHRRAKRLTDAEPLYREALDLYGRCLDPDHPRRTGALSRYASLLESQGRYAEAEPVYREALAAQRRTLGSSHREVGTTLNNLAGLLRKAGRPGEALPLLDEATEIYRRELGPDHAWMAIVLANRARACEALGDGPATERAAREALTIGGRYWPETHVRTAVVRSILGSALLLQDRREEARPLLAESLRDLEAALDADDTRVRDARERLRRAGSR